MKLVRIYDYGGPEQLRYEDAEPPVAGPGQVLVQVAACSVNPVDWKLRSGSAKAMMPFPMPLVLGGDVAGTIAALGEGVTGWAVGDAVFALLGLTGAYAETVAVDASFVARKPASLDFVAAASLPLVALTAWQGFAEDGRDLAGKRVFIHNGAGGVGTVAVQIAKALGATVLASASARNAEFVAGLGADEVVDFRETPAAGRAADIDIMLDLVGNAAATELWSLVRQGGSVIRIAGGADAAKLAEEQGIRIIKTRVKPNGAQLAEIGAMADRGAIKTEVGRVFPLNEAAAAQELSREGHTRGKIVLEIG